jgi:dolichol-phosphate mannosyltransferase
LTYALISKWHTGLAIPGWASTVVLSSLFGGLNALGIAVLGEYVIRIHQQVLGRPGFIVDRVDTYQASRVRDDSAQASADAEVILEQVDEIHRTIEDSRRTRRSGAHVAF